MDYLQDYHQKTPLCCYFPLCGGCQLQNLTYQDQLDYKWQRLKKQFKQALPTANSAVILPIIGSDEDTIFYRNKIRFAFTVDHEKVAFSRHNTQTGRSDLIIDHCLLESNRANRVLKAIARWATFNQIPVMSKDNQTGWLKFLLIREGKATGDLMIDLITNRGRLPMNSIELLVQELAKEKILLAKDSLFSLFQSETSGQSNQTVRLNHLLGSQFIREKIGRFLLRISHDSFMQTNPKMARVICETVLEYLHPNKSQTIWDLYSGTGTIGIYIADHIKAVIGVESCQSAVLDARKNAKQNNISKITFINSPVQKITNQINQPDVVIVDPPRAGLDNVTKRFLIDSRIKKMIYVSCFPETFLNDLVELTRDRFVVQAIQPIDSFPQTKHLEVVCLLESCN